jgi:hypothetical protein
LPPKLIRLAVRPSSTTPMPPGVMGMVPMMRMSAQAANASASETWAALTSSARRLTRSSRKTVRLPKSAQNVSMCQRRLSRSAALMRKRSKFWPFQSTGPRRRRRSTALAMRAAMSPMAMAVRSLARTSTNPPRTTPRMATPTKAAVASSGVLSPDAVSRNSATMG